MTTLIKICGLTRAADVRLAAGCGVDLVGFVLAESPRRVSPETVAKIGAEIPEKVMKVGVFVDAERDEIMEIADFCKLDLIQLHGHEDEAFARALSPRRVLRVCRLGSGRVLPAESFPYGWAALLDTWLPKQAGGGGRVFDWRLAEPWRGKPYFLAGGLNPGNVEAAIRQLRPFGVDVSSGVEAAPGIKDPDKLKTFVAAVRRADGNERLQERSFNLDRRVRDDA
ncbi:MAG TPA: phosphoribosylanthranilate isomerase [Proteobacteria bacterium]|nr:phosphoribosylanthranilate isomerase [Pseudomonadota bacterium]